MTADRRGNTAGRLAGFRAADPREAGYRAAALGLLEGREDPFSRNSFRPGHLTASGFVIHPAGNRLLLVFHLAMQRWLQPGGHFEPSDPDVVAAALREVTEETRLTRLQVVGDGLFDVDVHAVSHGGPPHRHFDLRVLFRSSSADAEPGDGVGGVRWMSLDELERAGTEESLLRPARKALVAVPGADAR